jgi:hypothetical protein
MKKLLLILLLILGYKVNAQCDYADDSDAPKELFRKRFFAVVGVPHQQPFTCVCLHTNPHFSCSTLAIVLQ